MTLLGQLGIIKDKSVEKLHSYSSLVALPTGANWKWDQLVSTRVADNLNHPKGASFFLRTNLRKKKLKNKK